MDKDEFQKKIKQQAPVNVRDDEPPNLGDEGDHFDSFTEEVIKEKGLDDENNDDQKAKAKAGGKSAQRKPGNAEDDDSGKDNGGKRSKASGDDGVDDEDNHRQANEDGEDPEEDEDEEGKEKPDGEEEDGEEEPDEVRQRKAYQQTLDSLNEAKGRIAEMEATDTWYKTLDSNPDMLKQLLKQAQIPGILVQDELSANDEIDNELIKLRKNYGEDFRPLSEDMDIPGTQSYRYKREARAIEERILKERAQREAARTNILKEAREKAVRSKLEYDKTIDNIIKKNHLKEDHEFIVKTRDSIMKVFDNPYALAKLAWEWASDANFGLNDQLKRRQVEKSLEAKNRKNRPPGQPVRSKGTESRSKTGEKQGTVSLEDLASDKEPF